jgi:hypothetical protein
MPGLKQVNIPMTQIAFVVSGEMTSSSCNPGICVRGNRRFCMDLPACSLDSNREQQRSSLALGSRYDLMNRRGPALGSVSSCEVVD